MSSIKSNSGVAVEGRRMRQKPHDQEFEHQVDLLAENVLRKICYSSLQIYSDCFITAKVLGRTSSLSIKH